MAEMAKLRVAPRLSHDKFLAIVFRTVNSIDTVEYYALFSTQTVKKFIGKYERFLEHVKFNLQ